jgi:hypothetical protein
MQVKRWAMLATIGAVLVLAGCKSDNVTEVHHPAKLEESGTEGIMRVVLEEKAVDRIGIQTTQVVALGSNLVVPYGAILYDTKGDTWTFTNPAPLTYVRAKIVVESVEGDRAILSQGPPAGTTVVTVGAAELMGAEHKYGH